MKKTGILLLLMENHEKEEEEKKAHRVTPLIMREDEVRRRGRVAKPIGRQEILGASGVWTEEKDKKEDEEGYRSRIIQWITEHQ